MNLSESEMLIKRLKPQTGKIRMVLDTDTYNEVDDQFALAYALKSPERLKVEAVYAAPFFNARVRNAAEGMEKSYQEILNLLEKMGIKSNGFVFKGSTDYLKSSDQPQESEAARDLIRRAMADDESPLYVVSIGAITNVASAILMEPRIIDRIVVVWLGGHALYWPQTIEFNLMQDVKAARLVLDSRVPLIQIPCMGVAAQLLTTDAELEQNLSGKSDIGSYLVDIVKGYAKDKKAFDWYNSALDIYLRGTDDNEAVATEYIEGTYAWSKIIWDIAAIAYLINPSWVPTTLVHSPILTDQMTWSFDNSRHFIRTANYVKRDHIFGDLFNKLINKTGC